MLQQNPHVRYYPKSDQFTSSPSNLRRVWIVIFILVGIRVLRKWYRRQSLINQWQKIRAAKREQLENEAKRFIQNHKTEFLPPGRLRDQILQADIKGLQALIKSKEATIVQILLTFIDKAVDPGLRHNYVLSQMYEVAYAEAVAQQKSFDADNTVIDRFKLFGIPVTIKDFLTVQGVDSTFGVGPQCFKPAPYDGREAAAVRREKGIIFLKSSVPQIGMSMETNNKIVGRASNPHNHERTTGGSSGGEAGLIATGASVVGVGTDSAGSLRNPAHFCGVLSYKPSSVRAGGPRRYSTTCYRFMGSRAFGSIYGPMARTVDDLVVMLRVLFADGNYGSAISDPYHRWVPFNDDQYASNQKLVIGKYKSFPIIPAAEPCQRAVEEACSALTKAGHTIVEVPFEQNFLLEALSLSYKILLADQSLKDYEEMLKGEPLIEEYKSFEMMCKIPKFMIKLAVLFLKLRNQREAIIAEALVKQWDAGELLEFFGRMVAMRNEMAEIWERLKLDAIVTPVAAGVAYRHGQSADGTLTVSYLMFWNFFDYNAGVVPVTAVRADEQNYRSTFNDKFNKCMQKCMKDSEGLPVAVQVISKPYEDEKCLRVMRDIELNR